jgi:hypothetical protein
MSNNSNDLRTLQVNVIENCKRRQSQIEGMLEQLAPMISNVGDATVIGPLVRDYLHLLQKNDEQILKVAEQLRKEQATTKTSGDSLLDENEKAELLRNIKELGSGE